MQFTKIRLAGRTNIDMPFFGLRPSNPYILKQADGLGPPEIDVFLSGGIYQGRKPQDREIIVRAGLNPNYAVGQTAASMRTTLYGLLTPGGNDNITVQLMNGPVVVVQTSGYVKRIEIVPFSKDPEVQITIACAKPYLYEPTEKTLGLLELGTPASPFTIENPGSVTAGFYLELTYNANQDTYWTLYSGGAGVAPKFRINYPFLNGDILMIDTREGQRSIKRTRGSSTINVLYALSTDSTWPTLHPGTNTFWTSSTSFNWGKAIFTPRYWGI